MILMTKMAKKVSFGLAVLLTISCQNRPVNEAAQAPQDWAGGMQGLATEVKDLIPYLYSRKAFFDPVNSAKIELGLKKFSSQAHQINPETAKGLFGEDPLVDYSLESLRSDLGRAAEAFQMGQLEYARGVAKAATEHCFRCHSLTKIGAKASWDISKMPTLTMTPIERADLMVASRRTDEAIHFLESTLNDQSFIQNFPFDFESALRKYLALILRTENKPERPLKELDRVLEIKGVPFYVTEQARAWRGSLLEWSRTQNKKIKKDKLAQARDRIARAAEVQQFAKDHAGDVEYLRATVLLHEFLKISQNAKQKAEAYFLLGQSYEVLDELGYWNLHEVYYETCVKTSPRSPLARGCYSRLEASIYMGYSGSSGVHVPASELERLKTLKAMTL